VAEISVGQGRGRIDFRFGLPSRGKRPFSWLLIGISGIVLIALLATFAVYSKYRNVQEEQALEQTRAFRDIMALMKDYSALKVALDRMDESPPGDAAARRGFEDMVDFLFVRHCYMRTSCPARRRC